MTRPHATQPGSAADARRLLAGLPEGATAEGWASTVPDLHAALTAALDREATLLTLLTEAAGIIAEHAAGYTVWLRAASVATRSPHLGDSDV